MRLLSIRYSAVSCESSLIRRGMTCRVLWVEVGVLGGCRANQKSSASRPVLYPWRAMGV